VSQMHGSAALETARRAAPGGGEGGGLVSSKTSRGPAVSVVSFDPRNASLARVARLKKAVWASGHLHGLTQAGERPAVCWFVTLTYRGVDDWRADHVSDALQRYRLWCRRKGIPCRYTWVAELQQRGAVHYHLLVWLPVGVTMPQWDRRLPCGRDAFWPHGMTNTQRAKAGVGYLMKYLSKLGEFHKFPKGLRLYGVGGLDHQARAVRRWLNLPSWAQCGAGVGDVVARVRGGVVLASGELLRSPWKVRRVPSGLLIQADQLPERWFAGPYSSLVH